MIYPIESPEEWGSKYDISPKSGKCPKCNKNITANIPFADGELRGFISKNCCGEDYRLIIFKPQNNHLLDIFDFANKNIDW